MARNLKVGVAARNAAIDAVVAILNGDPFVPPYIAFNKGDFPPTVEEAFDHVIINDLQLAYTPFADYPATPSFGPATGGSANSSGFDDGFVAQGGVCTWFFIASGDFTIVCMGSCGDAGDAPVDFQFDNKTWIASGTVRSESMAISMPE